MTVVIQIVALDSTIVNLLVYKQVSFELYHISVVYVSAGIEKGISSVWIPGRQPLKE